MIHSVNIVIFFIVIFLLQSCTSSGIVAPVDHRSEVESPLPKATRINGKVDRPISKSIINRNDSYHIVNDGDTLYSIAWRYNLDYKDIAIWNRINPPYIIYPRQLIRLKPFTKNTLSSKTNRTSLVPMKKGKTLKTETMGTTAKKIRPQSGAGSATGTMSHKKTDVITKQNSTKLSLPSGKIRWTWPTLGNVVKLNSPTSQKGINITGKVGQIVKAAAYGEIVYSGSGLLSYGKLIIIKHNETYLSAYAYNSKLLRKKGDRVHAGQAISHMGKDQTGRNVLHFEIRKNGKPVNPVQYLPKKQV